MWLTQLYNNSSSSSSSTFGESLKSLQSDLHHANTLAAGIPEDHYCVEMKLGYSPLAPFFIFIIEWMDYACTDSLPTYLGLLHILIYKIYVDEMRTTLSTDERKATLQEFYAVIYPWLKQLKENMKDNTNKVEEKRKLSNNEREEEECGICMENGSIIVLPNCVHSICSYCYHDWNARAESCPFCRGSLKTVGSEDLWVLTDKSDAVDMITLAKENLRYFYLFIQNLPLVVPADTPHLFLYDYLI